MRFHNSSQYYRWTDKILLAMAIISPIIFFMLIYICWSFTSMYLHFSSPLYKAVLWSLQYGWAPSLPLFLLLIITVFAGIKRWRFLLCLYVIAVPYLLPYELYADQYFWSSNFNSGFSGLSKLQSWLMTLLLALSIFGMITCVFEFFCEHYLKKLKQH